MSRSRWDETRDLIEAGWHSGWGVPCDCRHYCQRETTAGLPQNVYCAQRHPTIDWADTKQAQHDGSRQIYGDAGKFMRGGEPK